MKTIIIVLVPPILTLIGMSYWISRARRNRNTRRLIDSFRSPPK